ncbi:hypothetical protein GCM10028832_36680 [Streptomyces sparsus]
MLGSLGLRRVPVPPGSDSGGLSPAVGLPPATGAKPSLVKVAERPPENGHVTAVAEWVLLMGVLGSHA